MFQIDENNRLIMFNAVMWSIYVPYMLFYFSFRWVLLYKLLIFCHFSSRVFLLGPSHHYYTPKCALSSATVYKTPIGDLPIDLEGMTSIFFFSLFHYLV